MNSFSNDFMSQIRSSISLFIPLFHWLFKKTKSPKNKTYDYTQLVYGRDYVFEAVEDNPAKGYMTAQCQGVKRGDYIILRNGSNSHRYQVEKIDYYSQPPDMWVALLHKVTIE